MALNLDTGERIFEAALSLFRSDGFEKATMRDIAKAADVATGAAYYYYPSKEAIVLEFYRRASEEMQPKIERRLAGISKLEERLKRLIGVKLEQFASHRGVLRALLRKGADPAHELSPFSSQTKAIRDADVAWFARILTDVKVPRDLKEDLPGILWFFQMGVIFFWVIDESAEQAKTDELLDLGAKVVARLVAMAGLPFMKPVRRTALQMTKIVGGVVAGGGS